MKEQKISNLGKTAKTALAVLCCFLVASTARAGECSVRKPVVVIPGLMGTVLEGFVHT